MEFVGNRQPHWTKILLNNLQCVRARQYCWPNIMVHEMPVKFGLKHTTLTAKDMSQQLRTLKWRVQDWSMLVGTRSDEGKNMCCLWHLHVEMFRMGVDMKTWKKHCPSRKTKCTAWMSQCWSLASHLEAKGVYILYICCSGPALRILYIVYWSHVITHGLAAACLNYLISLSHLFDRSWPL